MGLFGSLFGKKPQRKKAKTSTATKTPSAAQIKAAMERDDRLMQRALDAGMAVDSAKDVAKAIDKYEAALRAAEGHGNYATHWLCLAKDCIKYDQMDRAWALLNELLTKYPDESARIRNEQVRILKKEKRWDEALRMLGMCHAVKYGDFNRDAFLRELKPIANKLGLTVDDHLTLADLVAKAKKKGSRAERVAADSFAEFLKARS